MTTHEIRLPLLFAVLALVAAAGIAGLYRLDIDTDIGKSLPGDDPLVADALAIFRNHPIHDQVAVDIALDRPDPETLVASASLLEERMEASGLFAEVGMAELAGLIPEVAARSVDQLPLMFSDRELATQVAPRLTPEAVDERLGRLLEDMAGLEGIGQAGSLAGDPLGLRELVLARMIHLAPSTSGRIYKGNLLSSDGRHLLLLARPAKAGSNTEAARRLMSFFAESGRQLNTALAESGSEATLTLTPTGSFRAALDNEEIIRHDVKLALGLSTAGIALLLCLAFPRPALSLLALVPPLVGIALALFVYSLFHDSISIMVLGFAGALISVLDDYSITYLLFLDRPRFARGRDAAFEVKAIGGVIALLTTIASFLILALGDFPVFTALGEFTALGLGFTYLFITLVCPRLFPELAPATRRNPPLHRLSTALFSFGKPGLIFALVLGASLLFFARPEFHLTLSSMNTVRQETSEASELFTRVWGDIGDRVYIMTSAADRAELQERNDRLLARLAEDRAEGRVGSAFNPSMLFPGPSLAERNLSAWRAFWNPERVAGLTRLLEEKGSEYGFARDAFRPFLAKLNGEVPASAGPPAAAYDRLLGVSGRADGRLVQFTAVTPGPNYSSADFFNTYGDSNAIFDSQAFSERIGDILYRTFTSSLLQMSLVIALLLLLYFLNWRLTLLTLLPLVFAYVCTLGTLNLLGHPLDIPALMLTVVILGLGIDYTVYTVCGRQRYGSAEHDSYVLVRSAVLLSAASTCIGFGVLCFAEHTTLKSVGITSLCGIGYSFLGTILILPPLLERYFAPDGGPQPKNIRAAVLHRYRRLEAYPRLFARGKLATDPLFAELAGLLGERQQIGRVLDIGCGYGVPACWCLERYPGSLVVAMDPDRERARVAQRVLGERGEVLCQAAPSLPADREGFDLILLLDMLHYLSEGELRETMAQCARLLRPGGLLAARFVTRPAGGKRSLHWYIEDLRSRRRAGIEPCYHTAETLAELLGACGLPGVEIRPSANPELFWLLGRNVSTAPTQARREGKRTMA